MKLWPMCLSSLGDKITRFVSKKSQLISLILNMRESQVRFFYITELFRYHLHTERAFPNMTPRWFSLSL